MDEQCLPWVIFEADSRKKPEIKRETEQKARFSNTCTSLIAPLILFAPLISHFKRGGKLFRSSWGNRRYSIHGTPSENFPSQSILSRKIKYFSHSFHSRPNADTERFLHNTMHARLAFFAPTTKGLFFYTRTKRSNRRSAQERIGFQDECEWDNDEASGWDPHHCVCGFWSYSR